MDYVKILKDIILDEILKKNKTYTKKSKDYLINLLQSKDLPKIKEAVEKHEKLNKVRTLGKIKTRTNLIKVTKPNYEIDCIFYKQISAEYKKQQGDVIITSKKSNFRYVKITKLVQFHVKSGTNINNLINKLLERRYEPTKENFYKALKILLTDNKFFDYYDQIEGYLDGIYIVSVHDIIYINENYNPLDNLLTAEEKTIASKFMMTQIDLSSDNFLDTYKNDLPKYSHINECFIDALLNFYDDYYPKENTQRRLGMTRENILKILNLTNDTVKFGISINQMEKVFETYKIRIKIWDFLYNIVYEYTPEKYQKLPILKAIVKNNHIYLVNSNENELKNYKADYQIYASSNFKIKEDTNDNIIFEMIEHATDMQKIMKLKTDEDNFIYTVVKNDKIIELLYELKSVGYEPNVFYVNGQLMGLTCFFYDKKNKSKYTFQIKTQQLTDNIDGYLTLDNQTTFNNNRLAFNTFYKKVFDKRHISFYSDEDIPILNELKTIAMLGKFEEPTNEELLEIDICKAYSSAFSKIKCIPKFTEFDIWQSYNNQAIEDYNLYIVQSNNFFFTKKYNLVYGIFLRKFDDIIITHVKKPSFIYNVDYKSIMTELWKQQISKNKIEDSKLKKLTANVIIGLMEKSTNTKNKSHIFNDVKEASYYADKFDGHLHHLYKYIESDTDVTVDENSPMYYIMNQTTQKTLKNGFRYIKELLLQYHNIEMFEVYTLLKNNGISIISVKTDAFIISCNKSRIEDILPLGNKIGDWRISKTDDINIMDSLNEQKINKMPIIKHQPTQNIIQMKDEWDSNEFNNLFETNKITLIKASLPGSGKSYACMKYAEMTNKKMIFVCPTNKLVQKYKLLGFESVTYNSFFGDYEFLEETEKRKTFNYTMFDVVVFDEIYFASIRMLTKIKKLIKTTDKIIIATGDVSQLECIDLCTNTYQLDNYIDNFVFKSIFENVIFLNKNKRLINPDDQIKLAQMKNEIFSDIPIEQTLRKYFKFTNIVDSQAICYTNKQCDEICKIIRKNKEDYQVGEFLVCRVYTRLKTIVFNVNYEYEVISKHKTTICIKDITSDELFYIPTEIIKKNFIYACARTAHSYQGSTCDGKLIIVGWDFHHATKKWIWTAITRTSNLENVCFYKK